MANDPARASIHNDVRVVRPHGDADHDPHPYATPSLRPVLSNVWRVTCAPLA